MKGTPGKLQHRGRRTAMGGRTRGGLRTARRTRTGGYGPNAETIPDPHTGTAERELLTAERHAALREASTQLPPRCQQLIALLAEDPPMSYAAIGARLGIQADSIGPSRGRCLDKLRRYLAIAALISAAHDLTT
jgi:DNA-directed RNA polymerase specialized sigma24 family protein